jgi:60 kDa SS-A/Ro ribonucleoprotein
MSVVGMTATDFTIADPEDPGTLDVAGFDSATPSLLADFARGDI